jgi:hypothetical protein
VQSQMPLHGTDQVALDRDFVEAGHRRSPARVLAKLDGDLIPAPASSSPARQVLERARHHFPLGSLTRATDRQVIYHGEFHAKLEQDYMYWRA